MIPWQTILIAVFLVILIGLQILSATNLFWSGLAALCALGLVAYLLIQGETDRRRGQELDHLKPAYDALDAQAKLIIKTDLELSRTQEELDKKVRGLVTVQAWGQRTRVITKVEELLAQFDEHLVEQLGYDRGFLLLYRRGGLDIQRQFFIGFPSNGTAALLKELHAKPLWKDVINQRQALLLNRPDATPGFQQELLKLCGLSSVIAIPLPLKDDEHHGLIAMGHEGLYAHVTTGDTDLLGLLATQLAIDLENVKLYEQLWDAHRMLELKVTERTRALATANDELIRLNRAKSDFVNAVAHELRTPLTSIKGYASILCSGQLGEMPEKQRERIAKIDKHSNDLGELINNLLDISRIESGKVTMSIRPINVPSLLRDIDDLVRPLVDEREMTFISDHDKVPEVLADPQQLKRVLMNLVSNAIKYTPAKGTIRVSVTNQSPETVLVRVSDTGAGIPADDLPHLFEEFYRAKTPMNDQVKGTGLGLTLVQHIIQAHGGRIWAESVVNEGSTFFFTLPKTLAAPATQEAT